GTVGTRTMERLIRECEKAGAKLVLVGDHRQLQAIGEAGAPFRYLGQKLGQAELRTIVRQKDEADCPAELDIADGRRRDSVESYARRGLITPADGTEMTKHTLIAAWREEGVQRPKENVICAPTKRDISALNALAQAERGRAGLLGPNSLPCGETRIYEG